MRTSTLQRIATGGARALGGLTEAQRRDVITLCNKGGYGLKKAVAMVTSPKVKVPVMVPRKEDASDARAE